MEFDDVQKLQGRGARDDEARPAEPLLHPRAGISPNVVTELAADLLETTGLIPADRLAGVRSRAGTGSIAQAIVDEGLAAPGVETPPPSPEPAGGLRRFDSAQSHLPQVDLVVEGGERAAAGQIPAPGL